MYSIVIPTKNEEKNIKGCLDSVSSFDDVHIVDSNSSDKTKQICKDYNVNFHEFSWNGQFPKKRNWALRNISFKYDFILFLDADERLTEEFITESVEEVSRNVHEGFLINYSNYFDNDLLKFGVPQKKLSLIKKGYAEYEKIELQQYKELDMEIHEHPIVKGSIGNIISRVIHNDKNDLESFILKHISYAKWEAERFINLKNTHQLSQRQKIKYRFINSYFFGMAYFLYTYIFRLGFLDGKAGFKYAFCKLFYFMIIKFYISKMLK